MNDHKMILYIKDVLKNMPTDWLKLTTHRLDIYNEKLAKKQFLEQFELLFDQYNIDPKALYALPTAYDYIRLGHPLSCVLEWAFARINKVKANNVISFSSEIMPILAVLRKNLLDHKDTQIVYTDAIPAGFDADLLKRIYGYKFELKKVDSVELIESYKGSTIFIGKQEDFCALNLLSNIDFYITLYADLGSILLVNGAKNEDYVLAIQHVRRRETIAMTPTDSLRALEMLVGQTTHYNMSDNINDNKAQVSKYINKIAGTDTKVLVASSGLSIQYAILMGLVHDALEKHQGKAIKIVVPPNCYGGTNDQARRVAACITNVKVMDLAVDGDSDMVLSIDSVLDCIAQEDAVALIIAEIPTNPRVEVPDLVQLKAVLTKKRTTDNGAEAIDPVFILDQTFCPNVRFLADNDSRSDVRTISFASGSKFPSGGLSNAGYCLGNKGAVDLIEKIEKHLSLCANEATDYQYAILAKQLPSMNQRVKDAYQNTRSFVNYIQEVLPTAKINFVSETLAKKGFTPSVFSLDLPTKGDTDEERENFKRALNLKLINLMITEIPDESKYCVSYGQLQGCYWTIPATSTQGTTKEGDKDYIARVALSPDMDLDLHKQVFLKFARSLGEIGTKVNV